MSGTVLTILAVAISAPCSPCMNWQIEWHCRLKRSQFLSFSVIFSQNGEP